MKKLVLAIITFISLTLCVHAVDTDLKVYDYNQSLTPKQEQILKEKADSFTKNYDIDVAFITVKYYKAKTTEAYAKEFFKKNEFGINNDRSAIIFILDYKENKNVEIFTNGKANDIYTEIEKDELEESIDLDRESYEIFNKLFKTTESRMKKNTGISKYIVFKKIYKKDYIFITIISLAVALVVTISLIIKSKINRKPKEDYKKVDFHITKSMDKFLGSHTEAYRFGSKK